MKWWLVVGIVVAGVLCGSEAGAEGATFSGYKCNIKHSLQLGKDGSAAATYTQRMRTATWSLS